MADTILIAHAASDENGWDGYEGSIPGDQTGKEIRIDNYVDVENAIGFTTVLRWTRQDMANAFATRMHQLADNENAGYSQPGRESGIAEIAKDPDPSHINKPVEFDCSAAVSSLAKATIESCGVSAKPITGREVTATMVKAFLASGYFVDVTAKVNLRTGEGLKVGDIPVKPVGHTGGIIKVEKQKDEPKKRIGTVYNCTTLNIRTGPGTEFQLCNIELPDGRGIRAYFEKGEKVEIIGEAPYWYNIKVTGAKYTWYPWVSKKYIKE